MKQFDLVTDEKIKSQLNTKLIGQEIYAFWKIGSTNTFARQRALHDAPEGTVVIAEEQTQGRGRMTRQWESQFGKGLWFSVILRPQDVSPKAGLYTFLAGVSVAEAVEQLCGLRPELKWPNDLLLNGKKFCGILSEADFQNGHIRHVILGIGINVDHKQEDLPNSISESATSIRIESNWRLDRVKLLITVLKRMEKNYELIQTKGFDPILKTWKSYCPRLSKQIKVRQEHTIYEGIFQDLDEHGCMLLKTNDGQMRKIVAGDFA
ncbi:biotin--[acetyl-CoA-carboxylase] ligase [candidate division KSB1 bacterium]|nr:biotin--[acetyl-CoA-carboxylase] ligase [candidate division KSB1 bacterium]